MNRFILYNLYYIFVYLLNNIIKMKELKKEILEQFGKRTIDWEELQTLDKERQEARKQKDVKKYLDVISQLYCKEFIYCYQNDLIFRKNVVYYLWLRTDLAIKWSYKELLIDLVKFYLWKITADEVINKYKIKVRKIWRWIGEYKVVWDIRTALWKKAQEEWKYFTHYLKENKISPEDVRNWSVGKTMSERKKQKLSELIEIKKYIENI